MEQSSNDPGKNFWRSFMIYLRMVLGFKMQNYSVSIIKQLEKRV
jgi:hypothetical protein